MNINEVISKLITNTEEIKKTYTTVECVRHCVYDIPYDDLNTFARSIDATIHTDMVLKRAYVIYSPFVNGKMDIDIWIYSTQVTIKPAEIIEY